jgi:hypothetical protein
MANGRNGGKASSSKKLNFSLDEDFSEGIIQLVIRI